MTETPQLWVIDLDDAGPNAVDSAFRTASEAERERARAFATNQLTERWLVSRLIVRVLLARRLQTAPSQITLGSHQTGQPVVQVLGDASAIRASWARSGGWLAVATASRPIGVDIERRLSVPEAKDLARRTLHEQDLADVLASSTPGETFLARWVRLEAELKRRGSGFDGSPPPRVGGRSNIADLAGLPSSLVGAVAVELTSKDGGHPLGDEILASLVRMQTIDEMLGVTR